MLVSFDSPAVDRDPERRRSTPDRPRTPRRRRSRAFRGRVESLEGRALLTFGTGGIVTGPVGQAFSLAIQPADQKIVVGGDGVNSKGAQGFALARYNTDGSLDTSFGSRGEVLTTFGSGDPAISSLLVQPDNKIVAGGSAPYLQVKGKSYQFVFALARYNADGSLDTSFGSGGKVTTLFPSISAGSGSGIGTVLPRPGGEILAVGSNGGQVVALALYKSNGAPDTSFGTSGTVVDTPMDTSTSTLNSDGTTTTVKTMFLARDTEVVATGGALESDNSILVSGTYWTETKVTNSTGGVLSDTSEYDLALVHYQPNGARDLSFGNHGIAIMGIAPAGVTTSDAWGSSVIVQPDGALVEVGSAMGPNGYSGIVVARYNANGTADTSFGGGAGYALIDMGTLGAYPSGDQVGSFGYSAALQPDGQIIVAGMVATSFSSTGHPAAYGFDTVRLNPDGSLDPGFGTNGAAITQVAYGEADPVSVGLETINNQAMIVDAARAGISATDGTQGLALVRYTPSGALDSGATAAATTTAAFTQPAGGMTSLAGSAPAGEFSGASTGRMTAGLAVSMPAAPSVLPVAGLVPQALDSPGLFDTLLPGRKRR